MIAAQDLRIGNKIGFYKSGINELQIGTIAEIALQENSSEYHFTIPEFSPSISITGAGLNPITLTPEIFLKCGFVVDKVDGDSVKFECYTLSPFTYSATFGWYSYGRKMENQPKYLHQLQNLYFALTGHELEINL